MQVILRNRRNRSKNTLHLIRLAQRYQAAFALMLVLLLVPARPLPLSAETKDSPGSEEQRAPHQEESMQGGSREQRIERLAGEIAEQLREDGAATTDTLFLKTGIQINCAILGETVSHYTISYKGLETIFPKNKIERVETRSREDAEKELRETALAKATKIVDCGLVRYGSEWVMPEEKTYRTMKAQVRSEAKEIEQNMRTHIEEVEAGVGSVQRARIAQVPITIVDRIGPQIFVDVTLAGNESSVTIPMLLDTGAEITCIHSSVADDLGLEHVVHVGIAMADGKGSVYPVVRVPEIAIQGMSVRGLQVFVGECGASSAQGMLGADFLRYFDFKIDPENNVMILRPR